MVCGIYHAYIIVYINIFTTMALTLAIPIAGRGTLAPSKAVWTGVARDIPLYEVKSDKDL